MSPEYHEDRVGQTRSCVDKRFTISAAAVERVIPPAAPHLADRESAVRCPIHSAPNLHSTSERARSVRVDSHQQPMRLRWAGSIESDHHHELPSTRYSSHLSPSTLVIGQTSALLKSKPLSTSRRHGSSRSLLPRSLADDPSDRSASTTPARGSSRTPSC